MFEWQYAWLNIFKISSKELLLLNICAWLDLRCWEMNLFSSSFVLNVFAFGVQRRYTHSHSPNVCWHQQAFPNKVTRFPPTSIYNNPKSLGMRVRCQNLMWWETVRQTYKGAAELSHYLIRPLFPAPAAAAKSSGECICVIEFRCWCCFSYLSSAALVAGCPICFDPRQVNGDMPAWRRPAKADTADERKTIWLCRKVSERHTEWERHREREWAKRERDIPLQVCTGTLISVISPLKTNFLLILLIFHRLLYSKIMPRRVVYIFALALLERDPENPFCSCKTGAAFQIRRLATLFHSPPSTALNGL